MSVVVLGSTGQLGHDLMRVFGERAIGLSHRDLDVTDGVGVVTTLMEIQPDWVINTAAYHNVDDCEKNPSLAFAVNAVGAANVARAAEAVGAGVVFISTDYVFGGNGRVRGTPHCESDSPDPINVYGVSKWAGERLVMQSNPRHLVVRSAGLFGTATSRKGWTFPELMITKAKAGEHLRVVDDQVLSPTYTADLASRVKSLIEHDAVGLVHLTNDGECSWYELACASLELAGLNAPIDPVPTDQLPDRARRPAYSALTSPRSIELCGEPLPPWQESLEAYLRAKQLI